MYVSVVLFAALGAGSRGRFGAIRSPLAGECRDAAPPFGAESVGGGVPRRCSPPYPLPNQRKAAALSTCGAACPGTPRVAGAHLSRGRGHGNAGANSKSPRYGPPPGQFEGANRRATAAFAIGFTNSGQPRGTRPYVLRNAHDSRQAGQAAGQLRFISGPQALPQHPRRPRDASA